MLLAATVLLGALSGYVLRRLGSGRQLRRWEQRVLRPLGWLLAALWISLAAALLAWEILR